MPQIPKQTRAWVLENYPDGIPNTSGSSPTFTLRIQDLPSLRPNQVLVKALYFSNDPAQRGWIDNTVPEERLYVPRVKIGEPMRARALGKVIASTSNAISRGDIVRGTLNWCEHAVLDIPAVQLVQSLSNGLDITHWLGVLGNTGLTANYGLVTVAEATKADRVVVSGAAGATGSIVVQIAKHIIGAKSVVGIAGSDAKCRWVESIGADQCINYKSPSFQKDLVEATRDGVDVYFDNVAGKILDMMLTRMSQGGRIAACGAITGYNSQNPCVLKNYFHIISMRLQLRGFIVLDVPPETRINIENSLRKAIDDGQIKIGADSETVITGSFDDVPKVWLGLFSGQNVGKLVTKLM